MSSWLFPGRALAQRPTKQSRQIDNPGLIILPTAQQSRWNGGEGYSYWQKPAALVNSPSNDSEEYTSRAKHGKHALPQASIQGTTMSGESEASQEEIERLSRRIKQLESKMNDKSRQYEESRQEVERLRQDRDMFESQVKTLENKVATLTQQLKNQSQETLCVAKAFYPNTVDVAAGADVAQIAEMLNHDIYQFVASLADEYERVDKPGRKPRGYGAQMREIARYFGKDVANLVSQTKERGNFSSVMQVLQTCMIVCCQDVLMSWCPFSDQEDFLTDAYASIIQDEGQAVAGPWRALLYRGSFVKYDSQTVMNTIEAKMTKVLQLLGWSAMSDEQLEMLKSIVEVTLEMHKVIRKDITSGDIVAFCPVPGERFDIGTMIADDEDGMMGNNVHCTIEMGLKKVTWERAYKNGEWVANGRELVILKPKVVLNNRA